MIHRSSFRKKKVYFHLAVQISQTHLSGRQIEFLWKDLGSRFRRHAFLTPHCCVLMSNHFHGVFEVPELCFEIAESALRAEFSQVQEYPLRPDSSSSFKVIRIQCFAAYREVYRYIYRNPIEAGICSRAENYKFSTLAELIGYQKPHVFASDAMGVISNPFQILDWINNSGASLNLH